MHIDSESLFQVITVLFLRHSRPYELVLLGRDDFFSNDPNYKANKYQTHVDFLRDMDAAIFAASDSKFKIEEHAALQYLFFVANVVAKDRELTLLPREFFLRATRELLRHH
jgi:hypothetical protein